MCRYLNWYLVIDGGEHVSGTVQIWCAALARTPLVQINEIEGEGEKETKVRNYSLGRSKLVHPRRVY